MILCSDPHAQFTQNKDAIESAIARVLDSGSYILGPETQAFEREFAQFVGVEYCLGVASGTDALLLALKACGIGAGDEVITVSFTASATVAAIRQSGAEVRYVDIDADSYTMRADQLERHISGKTKAIIPVHLYGHPAEITDILAVAKKHDLFVIEDCAQAHGATFNGQQVGSFGDIACFSFYPTKNLGALGDGGAVLSNNRELADRVALLREYGWKEKFNSSVHGWNSRLDEIQAAVLRVKLEKLNNFNENRALLAEIYNKELSDLDLDPPSVQKHCGHVYHLYVIRLKDRDRLLNHLREDGINAGIHYPIPVHRQEAYRSADSVLEVTETYSGEILSLPMYPELGEKIEKVCSSIKNYFDAGLPENEN